jgi:hypothetical protein
MVIADRAIRKAQKKAIVEHARFGLKPVIVSSKRKT